MTEKPIPESYWVIPDQFLAGGYPASTLGDETLTRQCLQAFLNAGFDTFIDLTRAGELPQYLPDLQSLAMIVGHPVDYQRFDFQDRGIPTNQQAVALLDSIDHALASGRKVYLHCWGGIGRTGTAVGCWLVRHGLTGEAALARLNLLYGTSEQSSYFSRSPETDAQVNFILDWNEPSPTVPSSPLSPGEKAASGSRLSPRDLAATQSGPMRLQGWRGRHDDFPWHKRFVQQAAWTRDLRAYLFERAGLAQAQRVLEVGCGTGAILSGLTTRAALHGLDLDPARLVEAARHVPQAALVCGDALQLPYPSAAFEVTFCHFLLLWLPDPLQALLEMARVTRPGGHVLALAEPDYAARVDKPAALAPLGRWQTESLQRQGADPGLGARLAELFRQAGIPPIETGTLQESKETLPASGERDLEWTLLEADLAGFIPPQEIQRMKILDLQAWERGERVLTVPTYFAWGRVNGI